MSKGKLQLKRAYAAYEETDGYRILVDRLWPRGVKKEKLHCNRWAKEISPSHELRKQFHGKEDFTGFTAAYQKELAENPEATAFVSDCKNILKEKNLTFVYASKNEKENNAVVLQEWFKHQ